ncbi:MAG: hypothetical protein KDE19_15310 [Caldilineaceae bacterium]|nr:hypothetical protein [Caldilineaceae bacterium]
MSPLDGLDDTSRYILPMSPGMNSSGGLPAHINDRGKPRCGAKVERFIFYDSLCSWDLCEECRQQDQ